MARQGGFFFGVLVGAGLMYLLDPDRGTRRRALIRDQVIHGGHELEDLGESVASRGRDLRNRAQGVVSETRARFRSEEVDDSVLDARVRSALGRLVSNPGAIHVAVRDGGVTLSGPVLASERETLVDGVEAVNGVAAVIDRLDAHAEPGDVPGLQGTQS